MCSENYLECFNEMRIKMMPMILYGSLFWLQEEIHLLWDLLQVCFQSVIRRELYKLREVSGLAGSRGNFYCIFASLLPGTQESLMIP